MQDLSNAHILIGSCGSRAAGTDAQQQMRAAPRPQPTEEDQRRLRTVLIILVAVEYALTRHTHTHTHTHTYYPFYSSGVCVFARSQWSTCVCVCVKLICICIFTTLRHTNVCMHSGVKVVPTPLITHMCNQWGRNYFYSTVHTHVCASQCGKYACV